MNSDNINETNNIESLNSKDEASLDSFNKDKYLELFSKYQYITAEMANMKKRFEIEKDSISSKVKNSFLLEITDILDALNLAQSHTQDESSRNLLLSLYDNIVGKFMLEPYGEIGDSFDPNFHEALSLSDGDTGLISNVFKKGYILNGKVLRYSLVEVGR